jgi:hypothetical protein
MKPCRKNRKQITWLALDVLDSQKAAALLDHLAQCESCNRYWEEISGLTERLAVARQVSDIEVSTSFHRQVSEKLRADESRSVRENLPACLCWLTPNWRIATPAIATLGIALLMVVGMQHPAAPTPPVPSIDQAASSSRSGIDLAPTIANYRIAASQSFEKLDELLLRQGNKPLPPAPIYTASGLILANTSF